MKKTILAVFLLLFCCSGSQAKDVVLSWDASPSAGVTGYELYIGNDPEIATPVQVYDAGMTLTHEVANLPEYEEHYFAVKAYDDAGNKSVYSNIVHAPAAIRPPEALRLTITYQTTIIVQ